MEERLDEYRKRLDKEEIPADLLDHAIEAGVQMARQEQKRRPRRIWILSVAMVAILLVGFSSIGKILEIIQHDKGLMSAVEHEYYEEIGVSEKKNGIEFVIDGAIADEKGLVLFYTIKTDEKQTNISFEDIDLKVLDGGKINPSSISSGGLHKRENSKKSSSGMLEFFFRDNLTSREFQLKTAVKGDGVRENFSLNFSLTKEIRMKKVYPLNKTVVIEGQKIDFVEATIFPLRVAIHLKIDPNNTKELLEIEDMRLVDEHGEVWSKILNGTTRTGVTEHEFIYYLQSNYFKEPKELYLAFGKIQAVDKEYREVVIDTEQMKILKQPPGNRLKGLEIYGGDIRMKLYTEKEFPYGIFSEVVDGKGNTVDITSNYMSSRRDEGYTLSGVTIPDLKSYPNPISLKLSFFPEWIIGDEKIKIK